MKTLNAGLMFLVMANSAFALDKAALDWRIQSLTTQLAEMQDKPGKAIPADLLGRARGVILLHRTKGGLVFGFQHGDGVAMMRDTNGVWSAPAFITDNEGSFGLQAGGETSFAAILLMSTNSFHELTDGSVRFEGEAHGTFGVESANEVGKVSDQPRMAVFGDSAGFFGGAAFKGDALAVNPTADGVYYGPGITARDILFERKVQPSDPASRLAKKLTEYSQPNKR